MLFEDETEYLVVTELFCEKYNLPFNEQAAENAAMTEDELTKAWAGKNYNSAAEVQEAFMNLLAERYKLELKKLVN